MKKSWLIMTSVLLVSLHSMAQKVMTEGVIQYAITVTEGADKPAVASAFEGASQTLMIKAYKARLDFKSPLRMQSGVYDAQSGNGFILKQSGTEKYLMPLEGGNWAKYHKRYQGIVFTKLAETKQIAGYNCTKATGKMTDGGTIVVYYCPELTILAKGYDPAFSILGGLPLEYEISSNGVVVNYKAQSVQMTMVSSGSFEMPKTGYKVLEFGK
jgi:hypothetical protein